MTLPIKPVEPAEPVKAAAASHSRAYTRIDAFYQRYFQGVSFRKLGAVLVPLQVSLTGVLVALRIPADKATYLSIAIAVALAIAFLVIPKDAQGLMLNLIQEADADPTKAERIAGAIASAGSAGQALRDGIAAATTPADAPDLGAPPATAPSAAKPAEGEGSDDATKP